MADAQGATSFFGTKAFPDRPDEVDDPKMALVNACRKSKKRSVKENVVPRLGSGRRVGELYEAELVEFGRDHWSVDRARLNSPSLDRAIRRMIATIETGGW